MDLLATVIPRPAPLLVSGELSVNWKTWIRHYKCYEVATKLNGEEDVVRIAALKASIGPDGLDIFDGLSLTQDEAKSYDTVVAKLEERCVGKVNTIYERYCFFTRDQKVEEPFDHYYESLRKLAKTCTFGDLTDELIRDRVVCGLHDTSQKKKLLQNANLTLASCVESCKLAELTSARLKKMSSHDTAEVHATNLTKTWRQRPTPVDSTSSQQPSRISNQPSTLKVCKFCGQRHLFQKRKCPAYGQVCSRCLGRNHFPSQCTMRISSLSHEHDSVMDTLDNQEVLTLEHISTMASFFSSKVFATLCLSGTCIKFQVDCGATVNVLSMKDYSAVSNGDNVSRLVPTSVKLVVYNNEIVEPLGSFQCQVRNPKTCETYLLQFMVVGKPTASIIGCVDAQRMKLITVNFENIQSLEGNLSMPITPAGMNLSTFSKLTLPQIHQEFSDVFHGTGNFQDKLTLEVDHSIRPVQKPVRKIPLELESRVKEKLDSLVEDEIIAPVDCHTPWISNLVTVTKKSGELRLCLDPKPLNHALKRNHFPMPTLDDVLPYLHNAKVFTLCDVKNGFWHVELDTPSSYLTTFGTPYGRFRWLRLPFGLKPAPEEFVRRLSAALEGLDGVKPVADDILIYGVGDTMEEAIQDNKRKFLALLTRCREKGIKLNKEKLIYMKPEVPYLGHVISKDGLKPAASKVEGILEMPPPVDKHGVQRLLAMTNFLQRFAPKLSEITAPMRELLKKDCAFVWDDQVHGVSFQNMKETLVNAPVLHYFDKSSPIVLQCDALSKGLGACLMQNGHPISYVSRALTAAECNYAQIEKELLAILFGMEKFELYVYGRYVTVESDHKPLEVITTKSLINTPKRLQRMLLRLQKYDFTVVFKPGSQMFIADALSRAYVPKLPSTHVSEDVFSIAHCLENIDMLRDIPVSCSTLQVVRDATSNDSTFCTLISLIKDGWPDTIKGVPRALHQYYGFQQDLTFQDGIILKCDRIVIPLSVRPEILKRLHASHIGIQGCLRRARECLYWPGMAGDIEKFVAMCPTCNSHRPNQPKEPLISHPLPSRPWEIVSTDLFEFEGRNYLITVDHYSDYFEIDRLTSQSSAEVIRCLKQHMARHGICDRLISDNGACYSSNEFHEFSLQFKFHHVTSSPHFAQSNGKAESAVKIAKNLMKKAITDHQDIYLVLLDWRNTPSQMVVGSPAQRLFGRRTKTLLPMTPKLLKPKLVTNVLPGLRKRKAKQAVYYNPGSKELCKLHPGQSVRFKLNPKSLWLSAKVVKQVDIGSYLIRTPHGAEYRRNRRHLRVVTEPESPEHWTTHDDSEVVPDNSGSNPVPPVGPESLAVSRPRRTVHPPAYLDDYVTE